MEIKLIAVIGAGAMGQGVAQVSAAAGYQVILNDLNEASLEKAMNGLRKNLGRLVEKGKMAEEEKLQIDPILLEQKAMQWEMAYNGMSPRTARQFINWMKAGGESG